MELRQMTAFLAVAEELHFGRAAARLHVAQPALSHTIRSLEKELGTSLFERTTRRVRLTPAGAALLEPARTIQGQVEGVARLARAAGDGVIGRVRVGFGGTSGYAVLSQVAREVARRRPGISLHLQPRLYAGDAVLALRDEEMDLAIVTPPVPKGIEVRVLREESVMLAVPSDHPLAERESVSMQQLREEPFIAYPSSHGSKVREIMMDLAEDAGFVPRVVQEAPDPYSLLALVGAAAGVAVVVSASAHIRIDGVTYVPLGEGEDAFTLALGWRRSNTAPALREVLAIAEEILPTGPHHS